MVTRRSASAPNIPALPRLQGLSLLVVDDHDDARDLLATLLRGAGANVTEAESVVMAVDALRREAFSVLVSDIAMPGQDGYDLIRWIRSPDAPGSARSIPAVAVTAFGMPEDRARALAAGFEEHVPKPVEVATLIEIIARLGLAAGQT
jgi:CheY-like chemotaxis protein